MLLPSVLLFVGLLLTQELFHRYARFSLWFFSIASIILFPCWVLLIGVDDWFAWLKVLSIATGIIVLSLFRTTRLGNTKWCQWTIYVFLVINILEAVMKDVTAGDLVNYLNAAAGVLLVATLSKVNTIHIDKKYRDLHWGSMTLSWIIGYTLWNWVFIYLNYVQTAPLHLAVLGSALVVAFIDQKRWLQARVFTLGMYFVIYHSTPHLSSNLPLYELGNESFELFTALITFGFMLAYTILFVRRSDLIR